MAFEAGAPARDWAPWGENREGESWSWSVAKKEDWGSQNREPEG